MGCQNLTYRENPTPLKVVCNTLKNSEKGCAGLYRYGFQGQESDDEVTGDKGTSVNYKYRMHNPRVGRFFAVDPLAAEYAYNSPYAFSENTVINAVELEGLEKQNVIADDGSEQTVNGPYSKSGAQAIANTQATQNKIQSPVESKDEIIPSLLPTPMGFMSNVTKTDNNSDGGITVDDVTKITDPVLFIAGVLNSSKEQIAKQVAQGYQFQVEAATELAEHSQYKVTITKPTQTGLANSTKTLSKIQVVGKVVGGIGVGFTVVDMVQNGVSVENSLDLAMGVAGFFPPTAVISMVYFGGKLLFSLIPEDADLSPSAVFEKEYEEAKNGTYPTGPNKW